MVYKYLRFNKDFLNKTNFKNHLMRKKKCIIEYRNIECSELLKELEKNNYQNYFNIRMKDHKCDFCNNFYKHKGFKNVHIITSISC